MSTNEERQAKRDKQREDHEKWLQEKEKERLAKPLVERLRDCGPFLAGDGYMSLAVGDWKDAHDAADTIEQLELRIEQLELQLETENLTPWKERIK
jgi:uncharacterized protein YciI